ncbi:maleylpyruvate isomerase family mycothiol-dependent enzyme [Jongsikchunia kroppenstedtii]|mgnify:CR=1 FL=1|uniref:maleylpyruvate isomerase family mycothiol-dependent enzyme n=1 Tax=Jongsikchunia kroppenstedtii TaxID=1121721 RepID=UPI00037A51A1|nr:maleylpyruvate isomerase family mycothiol-dependent enzyme [Jongsikchunia kroppenstedtii]
MSDGLVTTDEVYTAIADERRRLADLLSELTAEQWDTPSLCGDWSVRDVAAHLVVPLIMGVREFMPILLRARGNFDRSNVIAAQRVVEQHGPQLPELLAQHADSRFKPPGGGPRAPLTDILVHGQDIRRPLGIARDVVDADRWRTVLHFVTATRAGRIFGYRDMGVSWQATDIDWAGGAGPTVSGPAEAILMLMTGRPTALNDVTGDGVDVVRRRFAS